MGVSRALHPGDPSLERAQPMNHRLVLDGVFWVARTGSPWRDLPEKFGKGSSVYRQFRRWTLGAHVLSHPVQRTGRGRGARSEWRLLRLWNFSREPKAFELHPPLDAPVSLTATTFQAGSHGGPDRTGSSATLGL